MSDDKSAPTQGWKQRLLVGVASKPDAEFTIRWARDLAAALKCDWIAVHVEGATTSAKTETDVAQALRLAREFGAETLVTTDEDVVQGLMRVAEQRNATYVVIGRPTAQRTWWGRRSGDRTAIRLLQNSRGRQIYIATSEEQAALQSWRGNSVLRRTPKAQYLSVLAAIAALTGAGFLFTPVIGPHTTALIFLLVVVGLALLFDRGPALMAATLSAVAWDYFFLPPVFAFDVHSFEDAMFLVIFFAVALALGQLTNRIKTHQVNDRQREAKATALYLLTRELNQARSLNEILATAKAQLETAFQVASALIVRRSELKLNFQSPAIEIVDGDWVDQRIYEWVIEHSRPAGKSTDEFGDAQALYVPLTNTAGVVGVVALRLPDSRSISLR